jgi:hypothetical protein
MCGRASASGSACSARRSCYSSDNDPGKRPKMRATVAALVAFTMWADQAGLRSLLRLCVR